MESRDIFYLASIFQCASVIRMVSIFLCRDDSSSGDEELDEDAILRRRELMRQRALAKAQIGLGQEEIMDKEDEKSGTEEEEEESSEEETTDSEEEEGARLKPVFVRKKVCWGCSVLVVLIDDLLGCESNEMGVHWLVSQTSLMDSFRII